jgi:hypothetical protein
MEPLQSTPMQYVRRAGNDPSFLLKALREAAGELSRSVSGLSRREARLPATGPDEGWTLLAIPYHLRDTESGLIRQYQAITRWRDPEIDNVDLDDIPFEEDYRDEHLGDLIDEFRELRHTSSYLLWDLLPSEWEKAGIHPYRGRITLLEIVREAYQHDLAHLWQAQRMLEALTRPGGP